jgi:hypothetical protein
MHYKQSVAINQMGVTEDLSISRIAVGEKDKQCD